MSNLGERGYVLQSSAKQGNLSKKLYLQCQGPGPALVLEQLRHSWQKAPLLWEEPAEDTYIQEKIIFPQECEILFWYYHIFSNYMTHKNNYFTMYSYCLSMFWTPLSLPS